jgi:DNA gyrase/topoisomerase IV subunit B
MAAKPTYDQTDELSDWEFARLRTEVNFGSREIADETIVGYNGTKLIPEPVAFVPALGTYFREVVDNAIDEVIGHGHGDTIKITATDDLVFSVEDNGRGIPGDLVPKLLARARAGRNFRQRGNVAGTNGIGAAATNFTSEYFSVEARHNGESYVQHFEEDIKGNRLKEGRPTKGSISKSYHGTKITFKPSRHVYPNMVLPQSFIKARVYEIAIANPKLKVFFNGDRIKVDTKDLFRGYDPIIVECDGETEIRHTTARELGATEDTTTTHKFDSTFYLVPDFDENAKDDITHSLVNSISAYNGGTHMAAFRSAFYSGILEAIKPEAKRRKLEVARQDIAPGLLIYNITKMAAPNFDSQSKTKLTNPDAGRAVQKALDDKVFKKILTKNPEWAEKILQRCAERTQSKDLADAEKLSKKRLNKRVAKLDDATGSDRSKCILFIAEGDSAIKGMSNERNPKIHGGLPLTGKIMNVSGESHSKVVNSEALSNMMASIGLAIGKKAVRSQLRYGKICIATDEDEDGKNITALLVNFFYTYWPELFAPDLEPFIYKFETPYIILEKRGHKRVYFTGRTYDKFNPEEYKGWDIIRAKGLGRMKPAHWRDALADLSIIPFIDDGSLKESLDLIFNGERADDRKEWLKH